MADTSSAQFSLSVSRLLDAPRSRVFAAWTQAEAVKRWFAPGDAHVEYAHVDLRVGGTYRVHMRAPDGDEWVVSGTYREIRVPERLVFTWRWAHEPDAADMIVTLTLLERGERTELQLTHECIPHEASREKHEQGWIACLSKLETALRPSK